jgi:ubiquinone/menaquinone biosynthesis C-methylase UbiE
MAPDDLQKKHAIDTHSEQAEEFASSYREMAEDPYSSCFTYSRRRLALALERALPARGDGLRLLDVGCGTGHHLAGLRARGFDASGVDGSQEMLARARQMNPGVDLRTSDVDALPFPDASFDYVVCIEVLRYLPDPNACIREMARVLRPGGVALVTAQPYLNLNGYFLINRLPLKRQLGLVPLKQFFTTRGRLRRQLRAASFAEAQVHGVYWGPLNWVERLAKPAVRPFLRRWEALDAAVSDRPFFRDTANMLLAVAVKGK